MIQPHASYASDARRWIALIVVTAGVFMAMLDTTIVNIVLSKMMAELNADVYSVEWVLLSYTLGTTISMAVAGWLGSRLDIKVNFLGSMAVFTAMSALCGMAPNLNVMIATRFIQGLGNGIVVVTGLAFLRYIFPPERQGTAIGFYGLGAAVAPALGPTLGGLLTNNFSWRWVFYVNVPVGIAAVLAGFFFLRGSAAEERDRKPFDLLGFALMAVSLSALNVFLSKGQEYNWLENDMILYLLLIFIVSFPIFIVAQLRARDPLLDLRLFSRRNFAICCFILGCYSIVRFSVWVLLPIYMEQTRGYPTVTTGLVLLPGSVAASLAMILSGYLSDRRNPKALMFIGLGGMAMMDLFFHTDVATSKFVIAFDYAKWALFMSFVFSPLFKIALADVSAASASMAATILSVVNLLFSSVGISTSVAIFTRKADAVYDALSAKLNYASPIVRKEIAAGLLRDGAAFLGEPLTRLKANMQEFIATHGQAYAADDTFRLLALVSLLSIAIGLFIKYRRAGGGTGPLAGAA
jgi:DHA2 family multidrug resistance protein